MATKLRLNYGVALVTGAASGIGKEVALAFAESGVEGVVLADINEQGAKEAAEECKKYANATNFRAIAIQVDVTEEASVQNMVDTAVREFGRIDYNVNSAGMGNMSGAVISNLKIDTFSETFEVNVKGTMLCNRAVAKIMASQEPLSYTGRHGTRSLGRGSIVNLASVNSYIAAPGMTSYTASKHAVIGLTKSSDMNNIRVNAVCPSWVDTPMNHASLERVPQLAQMIKAFSPLHRVANVEEVADYIIFLCSPSASYINGTGLVIDAGMTVSAHGTG